MTPAVEIARLFLPDYEDFDFQHSHPDTWHGTTQYRAPGEDVTVLVTVKVVDRT